MPKPIIGVTLDSETNGGYSTMPFYAVRENYCDVISDNGGIPFCLPHYPECVNDYIQLLDGLLITGGGFDIPPQYFGETDIHSEVKLKQQRTEFEFAVTKASLIKDIPMLGICGGEQLLNVVLGGTLIQHIPDEISAPLDHMTGRAASHDIFIEPGTLLHQLTGTDSLLVNSEHHQAVKNPGPGIIVNARSSDGVIEGIESSKHRFCLGVQWHPEYILSNGDKHIFKEFIDAAK
jgi:putative glutamine amidotransferase